MGKSSGYITYYRARWLVFVALFVLGALWLVLGYQAPRVSPDDIKSAVKQENPPPQTIQQRAGPLSLDLGGMDLSLSSSDGSLKMRLWAADAHKTGDRYEISGGAMQFATDSDTTVTLEVDDAVYTQDDGIVRIIGAIKGVISGSEQYFEANEVEWDQSGNTLRTGLVNFRSPFFEVSGSEMSIDLLTGEIRFTGPITAGV